MKHNLFKLIINNLTNSLIDLTFNSYINENIMIIKNNEFTFIITKTNKKVNLFMSNNNVSTYDCYYHVDSIYRLAYNIVDSILYFIR